jgi:formate/nitrite transporter
MAWASGRVSTGRLLRNWLIVYAGNFTGALATAVGIYLSQQWTFDAHQVGATAVTIAVAKVNHGFLAAFVLGVFGNALVCLAVWLCFSARTTTDKILAIVPPITAFVAAGFEHSVANMYFIPIALFVRGDAHVLAQVHQPVGPLAQLTWAGFVLDNLIPVTLGNLVGGVVMVAAVYWFIYLRERPDNRVVRTWRYLARSRVEAVARRMTTVKHFKTIDRPTSGLCSPRESDHMAWFASHLDLPGDSDRLLGGFASISPTASNRRARPRASSGLWTYGGGAARAC